jgi:hypothetical protein
MARKDKCVVEGCKKERQIPNTDKCGQHFREQYGLSTPDYWAHRRAGMSHEEALTAGPLPKQRSPKGTRAPRKKPTPKAPRGGTEGTFPIESNGERPIEDKASIIKQALFSPDDDDDPELFALACIVDALKPLNRDQTERVLSYCGARFLKEAQV